MRVRLGERVVAIPELSALVLAELKADAEAWFGQPGHPGGGHGPGLLQRRPAPGHQGRRPHRRPRRAAHHQRADRAALAYGFGKQLEKKVVVFDLGGGTFDVSILDIGKSVFDVVAMGGDTYLGGEDFDRRIMDWLTFTFAKENGGVDLRQDKMALQRLKDAAERAKIELSSVPTADIHLPFLIPAGDGKQALHLTRQLTREKLEELTRTWWTAASR